MEAFKIIADLGFSIAAVFGGGFFIVLLLKYILESVTNGVLALNGMITALDNRVKTINNEIVRLDALICCALKLNLTFVECQLPMGKKMLGRIRIWKLLI